MAGDIRMDVNIKVPALEKLLDYGLAALAASQGPCWRLGKLAGTPEQDWFPHGERWKFRGF